MTESVGSNAVTLIESEDVRALETPLVRLEFRWDGTRWTHRLTEPATGVPLASSIECVQGRDDPTRPASPSYQEVTLQIEGEHGLAMAVGKYGHLHFAATFRVGHHPDGLPRPALIQGIDVSQRSTHPESMIEVDLAARSAETLGDLAATYSLHASPSKLSWSFDSGAGWEFDHLMLTLERHPDAAEGHTIQVAEDGRAACRAQIHTSLDRSSRTHRLKYGWIAADYSGMTCGMRQPVEPTATAQEPDHR